MGGFFSDFFKALVAPFALAMGGFKQAKKEKDLPKLVKAVGDVVTVLAIAAESTGDAIKTTGDVLAGPQKHEIVKSAALEIVAPAVNKLIDIPNVEEEGENVIFRTFLGAILDVLIHSAVARLNEKGWKF